MRFGASRTRRSAFLPELARRYCRRVFSCEASGSQPAGLVIAFSSIRAVARGNSRAHSPSFCSPTIGGNKGEAVSQRWSHSRPEAYALLSFPHPLLCGIWWNSRSDKQQPTVVIYRNRRASGHFETARCCSRICESKAGDLGHLTRPSGG
jgi:hypothetical protein